MCVVSLANWFFSGIFLMCLKSLSYISVYVRAFICICTYSCARAHIHTFCVCVCVIYEVCSEGDMKRILNLWLSKGVKLYYINVGTVSIWIVHLTCFSFCLTFGKYSVKIEWKPAKLKSRELWLQKKQQGRQCTVHIT
jgi:hypothetical protein